MREVSEEWGERSVRGMGVREERVRGVGVREVSKEWE